MKAQRTPGRGFPGHEQATKIIQENNSGYQVSVQPVEPVVRIRLKGAYLGAPCLIPGTLQDHIISV